MLYVLYSYLTNSINSLRVTFGYNIICFCFQMGASSQISANTHFHQHVSIIMQESGRSASNTTATLVLYRRTLPNNHIQVIRAEQYYCSLVWNFCEAAHTSKMESIPYRALICIYNFTSYEELLARANLPTLELHSKREILVEVFKYVSNISPYFMWDLFTK